MRRRYLVLRAFSLILRVVGWIAVIIGIVSFGWGLYELLRPATETMAIVAARDAVGGGVGTVLFGLILVLYGEVIEVFFDIEANTRRTAEVVERLAATPR